MGEKGMYGIEIDVKEESSMGENIKRNENDSVVQEKKKERHQDISPQRDPDKNDPPKK
jgi:hypothetical protein